MIHVLISHTKHSKYDYNVVEILKIVIYLIQVVLCVKLLKSGKRCTYYISIK